MNMRRLCIKLGKERQCHITKQLVHSFSVNARISQHSKVMSINPAVNLKRIRQLYNAKINFNSSYVFF